MSPATLLLILQIIQAAEAAAPPLVMLAVKLKRAMEQDPSVPEEFRKILADTSLTSADGVAKVDAWMKGV